MLELVVSLAAGAAAGYSSAKVVAWVKKQTASAKADVAKVEADVKAVANTVVTDVKKL